MTARCPVLGSDYFNLPSSSNRRRACVITLSTSVPNGTETGNAATGTHATICDTFGHCSGTVPAIAGINVDKKDPSVIVTTPEAGTPTYIINAVVNANYNCSDGGSVLQI